MGSRQASVNKPDLSDVTLVAADSVQPELAARALEESLKRCDFGDAILFSDKVVTGSFRHVPIPPLNSVRAYSRFLMRDLADFITTRYILNVQWDGYVVDAGAWRDQFRKFDYIGAPVYQADGEAVVGNGGFSWRSHKLLRATAKLPIVERVPCDMQIAVTFRKLLENDHGICIAPLRVAKRFAYELGPAVGSTFGFHGQFNFWRWESDDEVIRILRQRPTDSRFDKFAFFLIVECLHNNRRDLGQAIYALFREELSPDRMWEALKRTVPERRFRRIISELEPALSVGDAVVSRTA
jgi:hypothetical protein